MAVCSVVIKTALKHLGVISPTEEPEAEQAQDGLERLQQLYIDLVEHGTFGRLTDVYETGAYEAGEYERISGGATVTLPSEVTDLYTGETRSPRDLAIVVEVGGDTSLYDAQAGAWVALNGLALTDAAPLSARLDIAALLATRWPFYTRYITAPVQQLAAQTMLALTHKPAGPRRDMPATFF